MASIGVPGFLLLLPLIGLDPASALVAHGFAGANISLMLFLGGV